MNRYEALQHAVRAHGTQLDKGGNLYVLHPMAVADRVAANWQKLRAYHSGWPLGVSIESGVIVALLHDVIEDTDHELEARWFTTAQWDALDLVTHKPQDTYAEYIEQIAENPLATVVKLADLSHNLSPERQAALPVLEQRSLETRYFAARGRLWNALGQEWWPA